MGRTTNRPWSQRYDRKSSDLLAIQQEVALAATRQILPQVDPKDSAPGVQASVTDLMMLAGNISRRPLSPETGTRWYRCTDRFSSSTPSPHSRTARLAKALLYKAGRGGASGPTGTEHRPESGGSPCGTGSPTLGAVSQGRQRRTAPCDRIEPQRRKRAVLLRRLSVDAERQEPRRARAPHRARELDPMSFDLHRHGGNDLCAERQHRRGREALDDHPGTLSRRWRLRAFPYSRYRGPTG